MFSPTGGAATVEIGGSGCGLSGGASSENGRDIAENGENGIAENGGRIGSGGESGGDSGGNNCDGDKSGAGETGGKKRQRK